MQALLRELTVEVKRMRARVDLRMAFGDARPACGQPLEQARLQGRDATLSGGMDVLRAQLALQRSLTRLRVARRRVGGATGAPSSRP